MQNDGLTRVALPVRDDSYLDEELLRNTWKEADPFNKSWDELKDLAGLDANFKRRTARIEKQQYTDNYIDSARGVQSGTGDAKSKKINPGVVFRNAYGLFDVITGPMSFSLILLRSKLVINTSIPHYTGFLIINDALAPLCILLLMSLTKRLLPGRLDWMIELPKYEL